MKNLKHLYLYKGNAYLGIASSAKANGLSLKLGTRMFSLEPAETQEISDILNIFEHHFDANAAAETITSVPAEEKKGDLFACWVNHLGDWTLTGRNTLQLMISDKETACHLKLGDPWSIKAGSEPLVYKTNMGSHRGKAELRIIFENVTTKEKKEEIIAFDNKYHGGQKKEGYKNISLNLPFRNTEIKISQEIIYHGYEADGTGIEPFLFLADTQVGNANIGDQILTPQKLMHTSAPSKDVSWVKAFVGPYLTSSQSVLTLQNGKQSEDFPVAFKTNLEITDSYQHGFNIKADRSDIISLFIDGTPAKKLHLTEGDNFIRIPTKYLTGCDRSISLKDQTGSFTWLQKIINLPYSLTPVDVLQRESVAPFPSSVLPQIALRYDGLKAHLAAGDSIFDTQQISYAISVLEGGYENVKLKPLHFPQHTKPDVSIIIPAHNKVEVTYLALCSLLTAYNKASFEVIVVDDASTDETAELESIVSGIRVVHNTEPQRFIKSCNAGAALAKGEYVVLLNNDVEVTTGWLDSLIDAFSRFENVGLVGSKLLYPNGELQDAGGIIWGSGNPWNYGNRQNPNDPKFCYARQADYLSGAALMVPKKIWDDIGGLSNYLEPMYFEDTDLSFKVREAGYTTWFIPSSIVYHYEGMTSGTDVSTGFKKYQEVNRPKFKRRWAKAYSNFGKEGVSPDLEKDRGIIGRVLFVDYATPRPDQDAGSYAALKEIMLVQSLGYKVTFLPNNMAHFGSYTKILQDMGVEVIYAPFFLSTQEYLEKHASDFDAVYITRYYVAEDVLPTLKRIAPHVRVLFNNADLHFLREIRTAVALDDPAQLQQAQDTRRRELDIMRKVDVVLSYNESEHSVIEAYTDGEAKVAHCPWVVDIPSKIPSAKKRKGLSFLGSYRHHPNVEGIKWFVRDVMSSVPKNVNLAIYGAGMGDDIKALESDNIHPIGFVEDISDAYHQHRIFIAPLLSGAGIKGKVLAALAHGVPSILSPFAAEGIGLRHGHDCFIAEKPQEWVDAIKVLSSDDKLWQKISENAVTYMRDAYSFEEGRKKMRTAFEMADMFQSVE